MIGAQETVVHRGEELNCTVPPLWRVEVDQVTATEWPQLLDLFDDANIYQTWSYGAVRWGQKNLSHLVLKRNDEILAIAQLRIVRPAGVKFGMAYLRWGPLCQRRGTQLNSAVVERMARALESEYVTKRKLLLKIVPNAFVGSRRAELFQSAFSTFARESLNAENTYRTFLLDLSPSLEDLRKQLEPKWRNKLAGAAKGGLTVSEGSEFDLYRTFCRIYGEMRNRKTFESTVDVEEFGRIHQDLSENQKLRVLICRKEEVLVAGLVLSAIGDSAIYLLGATSDEGLKAKGSYLLQWAAIQWLKKNGIRCYDLGGINPPENPGVYQFKRGLSGHDVCQLPPITACRSVVSSALVRTGLSIHNAVRIFGAIRASNFNRAFAGE